MQIVQPILQDRLVQKIMLRFCQCSKAESGQSNINHNPHPYFHIMLDQTQLGWEGGRGRVQSRQSDHITIPGQDVPYPSPCPLNRMTWTRYLSLPLSTSSLNRITDTCGNITFPRIEGKLPDIDFYLQHYIPPSLSFFLWSFVTLTYLFLCHAVDWTSG